MESDGGGWRFRKGCCEGYSHSTAVFFFLNRSSVLPSHEELWSRSVNACFEAGEEESIFRLLNWDE